MAVRALFVLGADVVLASPGLTDPPCCATLPWKSHWICPGCPSSCSVCSGSGDRSGPTVPCRDIHWGQAWRCVNCPKICLVEPSPPSPTPSNRYVLHPFPDGAGDGMYALQIGIDRTVIRMIFVVNIYVQVVCICDDHYG